MTVVWEALERALDTQRPVFISGAPGSGKSTAARAAVECALECGVDALLVAAPSGAPDAGVLALASVARRLAGNTTTRVGWGALRAKTAEALHERSADTILVVDEPSSWQAAGGLFARRAEEAIETLLGPGSRWPAIVCDQGAVSGALKLPDSAREALGIGEWGALSSAASKLYAMPIASQLHTPLQQRLAVALVAWDQLPEHADTHRLASQLADVLVQRRHGASLWGAWQRLALARVPVDSATLGALGADRLSDIAKATLSIALLDGGGRLHDVMRTIPEDRPPDPELVEAQRRAAHEHLFAYHYACFVEDAEADRPEAADHAAESLFHAGELDDETRLDLVSVDLVEQLDALGYRLGMVHGDHAGAVAAYRRALVVDSSDTHAIHHLAFHMDVQGLDQHEVEAGYEQAVKADPGKAAWHARRVAFLVDTARPSAARRAWAEAESALAEDRGGPGLYADLHMPVAASLLAAGELSFCAYVLDGVPEHARTPQHRELSQLLAGRLAAQDSGAFVPAPRSGRKWWEQGAERLPARDTAGRLLVAWIAGRVEEVNDSGVSLHVARVDPDNGPYGIGLMRVPFDDFVTRVLDAVDPHAITPGTFVEVGRYRREGLEDETGIVVLNPPPVSMPIDVLPASRWQRAPTHGSP